MMPTAVYERYAGNTADGTISVEGHKEFLPDKIKARTIIFSPCCDCGGIERQGATEADIIICRRTSADLTSGENEFAAYLSK